MKIKLLTDPQYAASSWCHATLKGIREQAYLLKISLEELNDTDFFLSAANEPNCITIVTGTSINWINKISSRLLLEKPPFLLVTADYNLSFDGKISSILVDYRSAMQALLSHLEQNGNSKIAFFGMNPSSYADTVKSEFFAKEDIYYNYGNIATCTNQFFQQISRYDAAICSNDAAAIYLIHFLSKKGIQVPDCLHLASFGNFLLSNLTGPPLTSIAIDYRLLGQQAVRLCSFLIKNPSLTVNAFINGILKIKYSSKGSLQRKTVSTALPSISFHTPDSHPDINFYEDSAISSILALERLISESSRLDLQILELLLTGETLEKIAEYQNLSLSALRYRLKKMSALFPTHSRSAMLDALREYVSKDALTKVIFD